MMSVNDDDVKRLTDAIAAAQAETRQHIDTSLDRFRQENAAEFARLRQENAAAHQETRRYVDGSLETMRQENAAEFANVRQENATAHDETRRQSGIRGEALNPETHLFTEAVEFRFKAVAGRLARVGDSILRSAAETQAMIKFSHA